VADPKKIAHQLTYKLIEQKWTGAAFIVAPVDQLSALHEAFVTSWAAMLSAFSSGIAHADDEDPSVPEREKRLSELKRVVIVAAGLEIPPGSTAICFTSTDAPPPDGALRVNADFSN
jgi:hypothetical protein